MRRIMKTQALENKYGSDLSSIDCKEFKLQLGDKELVIADATRKALKELTPDQCKHAMLGIHSFFQMTVSYLQQRLPLGNQLLRQCLNPTKRKKNSIVSSIQVWHQCYNLRLVRLK